MLLVPSKQLSTHLCGLKDNPDDGPRLERECIGNILRMLQEKAAGLTYATAARRAPLQIVSELQEYN